MGTPTEIRTIPDEMTSRIRHTYDRASRWYDIEEWLPEKLAFRKWRERLWGLVPEGEILEVGVGTGRNLTYYRQGMTVTAMDFSPKMLARAEAKARRESIPATLRLMDVQALDFADSTFGSAVSTFVFCSVPEPVLGLREVSRVLRPGGRIYMLEHVLSRKRVVGWLMRRTNGLFRAMSGANIARDTLANVEKAGFKVIHAENLCLDIVKLIVAEKAALT